MEFCFEGLRVEARAELVRRETQRVDVDGRPGRAVDVHPRIELGVEHSGEHLGRQVARVPGQLAHRQRPVALEGEHDERKPCERVRIVDDARDAGLQRLPLEREAADREVERRRIGGVLENCDDGLGDFGDGEDVPERFLSESEQILVAALLHFW